jgi:hypothetical protein
MIEKLSDMGHIQLRKRNIYYFKTQIYIIIDLKGLTTEILDARNFLLILNFLKFLSQITHTSLNL